MSYKLENQASWWYNAVWIWGLKNQEGWSPRAGRDKCFNWNREEACPPSTFWFCSCPQMGWMMPTHMTDSHLYPVYWLKVLICSGNILTEGTWKEYFTSWASLSLIMLTHKKNYHKELSPSLIPLQIHCPSSSQNNLSKLCRKSRLSLLKTL